MNNDKRIVIEYNGWISVSKEDLKIVTVEKNGDMNNVDTSKLSEEEVVDMLTKGNYVISSFGETYLNNALDGEDNFTFLVEED